MNDEEDIQDTKNRGSGLASLTQLVAKGPDSDYIHKDATAHLFQGKYFKHTPFIVNNESFKTQLKFSDSYKFKIPNKGDFLKDIFCKFKLPNIYNINYLKWKSNISQRIIKTLFITVNNIDVYYQDNIYSGILNYLNAERTSDEIDFKVNFSSYKDPTDPEQKTIRDYAIVQVPIWNKTKSRQFFPVSLLHQSESYLNINLNEKHNLVTLKDDIYKIQKEGSTLTDSFKDIVYFQFIEYNKDYPDLYKLKIYIKIERTVEDEYIECKFVKNSQKNLIVKYINHTEDNNMLCSVVANKNIDKFSIKFIKLYDEDDLGYLDFDSNGITLNTDFQDFTFKKEIEIPFTLNYNNSDVKLSYSQGLDDEEIAAAAGFGEHFLELVDYDHKNLVNAANDIMIDINTEISTAKPEINVQYTVLSNIIYDYNQRMNSESTVIQAKLDRQFAQKKADNASDEDIKINIQMKNLQDELTKTVFDIKKNILTINEFVEDAEYYADYSEQLATIELNKLTITSTEIETIEKET